MSEDHTPLHLGGPLGLAGLAVLAGATGLFVMNGPDAPAPQQAGISQTEPQPGTPAPRPHPGDAIPMVQPAELPASAETRAPAGIKLAQVNTAGTEVVFIVRIKGEPEIDVISRNYKRDPAVAETAWANLQARYPVLADFTLVGASYSGEIKLAYQLPPGLEPTRATINDIQSRILQVNSVAYADPDYVAQPGKE
jgi:hypothetical protein